MIEMVVINIGNNHDLRGELMKTTITLVGLSNQPGPLAQECRRLNQIQTTSHNNCGLGFRMQEQRGCHTCCSGFAM